MIRKLICDRKSYNHQIITRPQKVAVEVNKEKFINIACEVYCKHQNCEIPRDTCTSLGTCKNHDDFRRELTEKLFN